MISSYNYVIRFAVITDENVMLHTWYMMDLSMVSLYHTDVAYFPDKKITFYYHLMGITSTIQ